MTIYPSGPDTLYAIGGWFFRSTDHGEHWDSLSGLVTDYGDIKTDPFNSRIIYASVYGFSSNNVVVSSDGGLTWEIKLIGTGPFGAPFIEIDPGDMHTVYAGKGPGSLMRSTDWGQNWEEIAYFSGLNDFRIAPSNDSVMYALTYNTVRRSTDKGVTWLSLPTSYGGVRLAIHPRDPDTVYVIVQSSGDEPRGVYKTTDGGMSWNQMNNGLDSLQMYEWFFNAIAINPRYPNEVFIGTGSGQRNLFFRSTNGGALWERAVDGLPAEGHVGCISVDTLSNTLYVGVTAQDSSGIYILDDVLLNAETEQPFLSIPYTLFANYPNPFNPVTTIVYELPEISYVRLKVYDILGRKIHILVDAVQNPGTHNVVFDARGLPSGTYLYQIESHYGLLRRKALLLK
jgi:photosystem II stability/assembly factor-like uncharacterized protein